MSETDLHQSIIWFRNTISSATARCHRQAPCTIHGRLRATGFGAWRLQIGSSKLVEGQDRTPLNASLLYLGLARSAARPLCHE